MGALSSMESQNSSIKGARMRVMRRTAISVVSVVAALVLSACGGSTDEATTAESSSAFKGATEESSLPKLEIFFDLLEVSGIDVTQLADNTIFAPTNEAFDALDDNVFDALLLEENADALTELLAYHIVQGKIILPGDGTDGLVITPNGEKLDISTANGVVVNGILASDSAGSSNGVTYALPEVLMPPNWLESYSSLQLE
jgi:uncharacterized surface protein with fasciclin (FAS1) repeats